MSEFVEAFGHAQTFASLATAIRRKSDPWHSPTEQFIRDLEEFGREGYIASWLRLTIGIGVHGDVFTLFTREGYEPVRDKLPRKFLSKSKLAGRHPLPLAEKDDAITDVLADINKCINRLPGRIVVASPYVFSTDGDSFLERQPFYSEEFRRIHTEKLYGEMI
jgi:hypothetical protein